MAKLPKILNGTIPAEALLANIKTQIKDLSPDKPRPCVAFVLVGEDGPSATYVARKKKIAQETGFVSRVIHLPESISEQSLLETIRQLNADSAVHGFLVQAPLPKSINAIRIFNTISPQKDVDGFNALNIGQLCQGDTTGFTPCTPTGIATLLSYYQISTEGKSIVIIGRSLTVGKPAALLFLEKAWNATVTICHSQTKNLANFTKNADILIVATGKPQWINSEHIKEEAIVIDVGINRLKDKTAQKGYRLTGDVNFESVAPLVSAITPVPGGIGPLTVAHLMANTWKAYQNCFAEKF